MNIMDFNLKKNERFGEMVVDFYEMSGEIFMTAKQIGVALGYEYPVDAIHGIHEENVERLFALSFLVESEQSEPEIFFSTPEYITLYNEKGIYEIVRKSNQQEADKFFDYVYDVIDKVRKNGGYIYVEDNMTEDDILERAMSIAKQTIANK